MSFSYFDTHHAILVHDEIINNSGGMLGILNQGLLESVLEHIKNDFYYPNMEDKITHLFFSINKNHSFHDGNKRASIALSAYFLIINDCSLKVQRFIREMENVAVDVADNRIGRDLLYEIITSIIYENDFSEEIKLKVIYSKGL
ncbi:type II toxin-antitoxin system death-on-curing family toxin [Pedobacter fastidiosus]|uniref:Type II toxin-antitoxin system death-on-curing family toxin n=1 Tax=Pedobacter fastidiosus TaxID=2765361 RepID=A0ABR7KPY2_9SPHI|nr:type II toxin-antitoxin system death-on-curing family toxin [Pedobacter fastidiosus]MBC6110156.1 type II toxin-antitoxin system death-on-curing family toxin [Pedobacter fastidiosus]